MGDNAKSKKRQSCHSCTRHVVSFCSTTFPSIIKIFQRVFGLQSGHEINGLSLSNITKGGSTKSKKSRVVILVRDTLSGPVLHFCQVLSKYFKGYSSYKMYTIFCQIKQRVVTQKVRKAELSFLYPTGRLVLLYISTKYYQNIPKSNQVTERTRSFTPTPTPTPVPTGSVPKTICPSPLVCVWAGMGGRVGGGGHNHCQI